MAGRDGSKQQAWRQKQEAERAYLQIQPGAENKLAEVAQGS